MVYTVTFNPSIDYVVSVNGFKCGTVNRTVKERMFPGGKGINVSLVLKNLGYEICAFGFIAGFTGDRLESLLKDKGICTDFVRTSGGMTRINIKIKSDMETEINGQGPLISEKDLEYLYDRLGKLKEGDILVLAGSVPVSIPQSAYMDIIKYMQKKNIKTIVDATKELLTNSLCCHPFLIKPNKYELEEIFGVTINNREEIKEYAVRLREMGAENVIVSVGGEGAVLAAKDGTIYDYKAPDGKVVNSVGAGDSMVAGFIAGYLKSGKYDEALKWGLCTGSASAFSEELATEEEVMQLLESFRK